MDSNLKEALIECAQQVSRLDGPPDCFFAPILRKCSECHQQIFLNINHQIASIVCMNCEVDFHGDEINQIISEEIQRFSSKMEKQNA